MTETRLRWESNDPDVSHGYIGTLQPWAFAICHPDRPGGFWMVTTQFPLGQPRYVSSEEEAQRAAERWLAEFVSSLGAIFPAEFRAAVKEQRDYHQDMAAEHAEYGRDDKAGNGYAMVNALDWVTALIDRESPATPVAGKEKE